MSTWHEIADMLANRLENFEYCADHESMDEDPACPFCHDCRVMRTYRAKSGRSRRIDHGTPVPLSEIWRMGT